MKNINRKNKEIQEKLGSLKGKHLSLKSSAGKTTNWQQQQKESYELL